MYPLGNIKCMHTNTVPFDSYETFAVCMTGRENTHAAPDREPIPYNCNQLASSFCSSIPFPSQTMGAGQSTNKYTLALILNTMKWQS